MFTPPNDGALTIRCVHEMFERHVHQTPDAIAIRCGERTLTYAELDHRAARTAEHLLVDGVVTGDVVGLFVERSEIMLVGLLGIMKAGAACLPLDGRLPDERLSFILKDSQTTRVLTQQTWRSRLSHHGASLLCIEDVEDVVCAMSSFPKGSPDALAYVLYTSGSTGVPKGVAMPQRALANLVQWQLKQTPSGSQGHSLQLAPLSFDVSFQEIFSTWAVGATLVLTPESTRQDPKELMALLVRETVQRLFLPPALLAELALVAGELDAVAPELREVIVAGDQLRISPSVIEFFERTAPHATLANHYGPTETHVVTSYLLRGPPKQWAAAPPIGKPIAGCTVFLLDPHLKPVPAGQEGEIYVGGCGLARGYHHQPTLTEQRFIPNPFGAGRLYKTGDLARQLPNGDYVFVGRMDNQVKVRGHRVELEEVEAVLNRHPAVHQSLVRLQGGSTDDERSRDEKLVAYVQTTKKNDVLVYQDLIAAWGQLWDQAYTQHDAAPDRRLNTAGWTDSFTGEPIPDTDMMEWADVTTERILGFQPKRVLEIGCGTGMLLFRIAPFCEQYCAVDISETALQYIRREVEKQPGDGSQIELAKSAAHDLAAFDGYEFDTIIINSVVPLFPSIHYLIRVLDRSVEMLGTSGRIFVGDVRNLRLIDAFHLTKQLHRQPADFSMVELEAAVSKSISSEAQLLVDPAFFQEASTRFPRVCRSEVQLRRGWADNEMNRYRYDAVLVVGEASSPPSEQPLSLDWTTDSPTLASVRERLLNNEPTALKVMNVPNARLSKDAELIRLYAQRTPAVLDALNGTGGDAPGKVGVEPEHWWRMGDELAYQVSVGWSESLDCVNVFFRKDAESPLTPPDPPTGRSLSSYANAPAQRGIATRLGRRLRTHLRAFLPDYMLPSFFVLMDRLPLTASGKLDRRSLPPALPAQSHPLTANPWTAKADASQPEAAIASVWRQVLGIDNIDPGDTFFELGGDSIMLLRARSHLEQIFGIDVPVATLFEHPTIGGLANHLRDGGIEPAEDQRRTVPGVQPPNPGDVAIIGLACRLPGCANASQYWHHLVEGVENINRPDNQGGVPFGALSDIAMFDARFFGYTPKEAKLIDPQQRLFLECAWRALEDAAYIAPHQGCSIGVYAGSGMNTYLLNHVVPSEQTGAGQNFLGSAVELQIRLANEAASLPTRVSYKLNLTGPSVNVQSACSTSLVAVHMAVQSLRMGECDIALAGGVAVSVPQQPLVAKDANFILSSDGRCRPFDANADGAVFGNGVGVVVLKPLTKAEADGDQIYAVIRGSAINNDGGTKLSYTAPSVTGQAAVIADALKDAGLRARDIGYVECHGTGTRLGDPVEIAALTKAYGPVARDTGFCALGSVKASIGHLQEAAGIAGLLKTALMLKHKQIPGTLHYSQANAEIDFDNSPFFVNTHLNPWSVESGELRRAGVSSFGMGGTNAHLILEEGPERPHRKGAQPPLSTGLFVLSAKSAEALTALAGDYLSYLTSPAAGSFQDICFTASAGRRHFEHRLALVAADKRELADQLERWQSSPPHLDDDVANPSSAPKVAFLFSGQGAHNGALSRALYETEPHFRATIQRCDALLRPHWDVSLIEVLYPTERRATPLLDETAYAQGALFSLCYSLAELWRHWGIEPALLAGHSVGEYVAACYAGVVSLEDALMLLVQRGQLMQAMPDTGGMLAVFATERRVRETLARYDADLDIAAINTRESVVLSGQRDALQRLSGLLDEEGIVSKALRVSRAFHSRWMEPMVSDFRAAVQAVEFSAPAIPVISSVTGQSIGEELATADHWCRHVRQPVRFARTMEQLREEGANVFVEIGPGTVLTAMGKQCLTEPSHLRWLSSLRPGRDPWRHILASLGEAYVSGLNVNGSRLGPTQSGRRVSLPTYPFQREAHWIHPPEIADQGTSEGEDSQWETLSAEPATTVRRAAEGLGQRAAAMTDPTARVAFLQNHIHSVLASVLGLEPEALSMKSHFMDAGLDSLAAVTFLSRLKSRLDVSLGVPHLWQYSSTHALARYLSTRLANDLARPMGEESGVSTLVPIQPHGNAPALFFIPGILGHPYGYRVLAESIGNTQPFFALRSFGLHEDDAPHTSIQRIAAHHITHVRRVQARGPYLLAGHSFGALVAFEMTRQLLDQGEKVSRLFLIDGPADKASALVNANGAGSGMRAHRFAYFHAKATGKPLLVTTDALGPLGLNGEIATGRSPWISTSAKGYGPAEIQRMVAVFEANWRAHEAYSVDERIDSPIILLRASEALAAGDDSQFHGDPSLGWEKASSSPITIDFVAGDHFSMLDQPHVIDLAARLRSHMPHAKGNHSDC